MRFRGREVAHPELGRDILQRLYDAVEDYAEIEAMPRLDGRNMTMVLVPAADMPDEVESEAIDDEELDDIMDAPETEDDTIESMEVESDEDEADDESSE